ncbi:protein misato homolog 1 [Melopsittacus undulatus]|uniref:protein misato homolog 1 n=1 Tax=Melopsittacus undulatus TaxID=13146 RepID=UPI00146DD840|nr:protein misato homolog 1 [Melopsittacus undulatus]
MPAEAVTLQLGPYAGSTGAHWWGLQAAALRRPAEAAELRSSALLRPAHAPGGREVHVPRLVALQLKGSGGALRNGDASVEAPVTWNGAVAAYLDTGSQGTGVPASGSAEARGVCSDAGGTQGPRPPEQDAPSPCPAGPGAPPGMGHWCCPEGLGTDAGPCAVSDRETDGIQAPAYGQRGERLPSSHLIPGAAPAPSPLAAVQDVPSGRNVPLWSHHPNVQLHPKSLYIIRQYMHDGDCGCLEAFAQGEGLLQDPACMEELEDRLHYFTEECDSLQGFQVLCDLHNGFSGVGAKVTELLRDEYSGKGILSWGLTPALSSGADSHRNAYRLMNTALGIIHLSTHSSLFCPMSLGGSLGLKPQPPVTFPYLSYDASLSSHSSAILAAALDTLTVPYRLSCSQGSILHLAETLNFSGRKVAAAWASVPFPALHGSSLPDALCTHQDVPWKLLASCRERRGSSCFAQSVVLRGLGKDRASSSPGRQPRSPLHAWESPELILQHYLHTAFPGAFSTSHVLEQPCYTPAPYPQFFSPRLSRQGFLLDQAPPSSPAAVESIPVLAALRSAPVLHTLLYGLYKDLQQLNPRRCASFFSAGLEQEDFQEALHRLRTLSQCYETELEAEESDDEADSD